MMRSNRLPAVLVLAGVLSFGCKSTNEPPTPVPTSLTASVTQVDLAAIDASATVTVTVRDQDGAAMSGQPVSWATGNAAVATVTGTGTGTITAVGNGSTTVTATSGSLSVQVTVNVTQVTTQIVKISGDLQSGAAGGALAAALVVEQRDSRGNAVPGGTGSLVANAAVTFAVASGGGSLSAASVTVGTDGRASVNWTLGTAAGAQTVTATAGVASAGTVTFSATATAGPADSLRLISGDAQSGRVSQPLADSLVVQAVDAFGNPFAGRAVDFATPSGGSVSAAAVMTGADGRAAVRWTLGPAGGAQTATATATGLKSSPITFTATAVGPDSLEKVSGDGQTAAINTTLADSIVVVVRDQSGAPFSGHKVAFEATTGGGSVSADTVITNASGQAGVRWTLGATPGAQTATVTAVGVTKGSPATFTATGVLQVATALVKVDGDNLIGLPGKATNIPPVIMVQDQAANGMAGVNVTFTVTGGGGTIEGGNTVNTVTDADGLATLADWTLGGTAGANAIEVTSGALTPVSFSATGQTAAYDIVVQFYGNTGQLSAGALAAFAAAEAKWESLIFGDLPAEQVTLTAGACGSAFSDHPAVNEQVDDLRILAKIDSIDGPGGVLGAAGPCWIRGGAAAPLTALGVMRFDSADVAARVADGSFERIVVHEMGHVVGIGSLWNLPPLSLRVGTCPIPSTNCTTDPHFVGARAIAAFDRVGGTAYTAGAKVPVEDCVTGVPASCGQAPGTINTHWRESVLSVELMTGYISTNVPNPLSLISVASLWDMNYLVSYADADPYSWPSPPAGVVAASGTGWVSLGDDVHRGPLYFRDAFGRVVRRDPR